MNHETPSQKIVLLVDDEPLVLRSISRVLKRRFDVVLTASNQAEAEKHLEEHTVTHVVCDYHLGADQPRGTTLLSEWRGQHPGIERAVILTGTARESIPPAPIGIDDILDKLCSQEVLFEKLLV